MQSDIDNMNRHYEKLVGYVDQYVVQAVVEWARLVVNHPKALLLVMETTRVVDENGTSGDSEPIRLTALPLEAGGNIWDQLLCPTYSRNVQGAEYHGLAMADLRDKPRLADAWTHIEQMLEGQHIIIFGAEWACNALRSVRHTHALDQAFCLHNKCKEYYNQFYDLSLATILNYQNIDKKREELRDSRERILVLAQIVRNLAAAMPKQSQESEGLESFPEDLDSQPF
jgi:DNA polymerase III epsilon subunit-like protein